MSTKDILKEAIALYDAGNEEEAQKLFAKVLAIEPGNKVAQEYANMSEGEEEVDMEDEAAGDDEEEMDMDMEGEEDMEARDNEGVQGEIMTSLFDIFSRENKGEEISGEELDDIIAQLEEYKNTLGA